MAGVVPIPDVPINFVPIREGETFKLGPMTCRVLEDGSRTGKITFAFPTLPFLTKFQTTASESPNLPSRPRHLAHLPTGTKCTTRPSS